MKNTQLKEQLKKSFINTVLSVKNTVEPTAKINKTIFDFRAKLEINNSNNKIKQKTL